MLLLCILEYKVNRRLSVLSCLVLGDSIAVGTAMYKPHCELHAKVGINSLAWTQHYLTNDLGANKLLLA